MSPRSTRELWPDDEPEFNRELDDLESESREILGRIRRLTVEARSILERAAAVRAGAPASAHELEVLAADLAAIPRPCDVSDSVSQIVDAIQALLNADPAHDELPVEWRALLDPATSDADRASAAAEYAARFGSKDKLRKLLHERRYDVQCDRIEAAIHDEAAGGAHAAVLRDAIAQAVLVASTEARAPQDKVRVAGHMYVHGTAAAQLVPWRDLPPHLLRAWMQAEVRRYLLDRWIPDWRDREHLTETRGLRVVSVDDVASELAPTASASLDRSALVAELEAAVGSLNMTIARLRSQGLTHPEIAARLGRSHADVRQRWSRTKRLAKRLRGARGRDVSHPPGACDASHECAGELRQRARAPDTTSRAASDPGLRW